MTHFNGTPKDYAVTLGLAKAGKGRMSREAHEAVAKAMSEGMTFNGSRPGVVRGEAPKGPVVSKERPKADDKPKEHAEGLNVYAEAFMRYPLDQEFTYDDDKGKRHVINARQACMNCRYSLAGHGCNNPVVLTKHGPRNVKPKGE